MQIKSLRERMMVQKRTYHPDQHGGHTLSWTDEKEIWVSIKPVRGPYAEHEESVFARIYKISWRAEETVSHLSQLKWRGYLLRFITRPQEDIAKRWTTALAKVIEENRNE